MPLGAPRRAPRRAVTALRPYVPTETAVFQGLREVFATVRARMPEG